MNCPVSERQIYLLCDGLLQEEERSEVEAHVLACGRCRKTYDEARQSLALLNQPAPEHLILDPATADSIISQALEDSNHRPKVIAMRFGRKTYPLLAAAALLLFVLVSGIYLLSNVRTSGKNIAAVVAQTAKPETTILTSAKDTTVIFNRMCALRASIDTKVTIDRRGPRVVYFDLSQGSVQVAAHKGLYDTIAVRCAPVTVFATGTHFSVERTGSDVRVSVVEGAVELSNTQTGGRMPLSCGELCLVNGTNRTWEKVALPEPVQKQLTDIFEIMVSSDFALVPVPVTGAHQQHGVRFQEPAREKRDYDTVRGLIRHGDYDKAIVAIVEHLASAPLDRDVAYCDLALCYSRTDRWESALDAYASASAATTDSLVKEAVLHRVNSILFSKLARFSEAGSGIRDYLLRYPRGAWREREYGMLIRIEIAQNHREEAQRSVDRYAFEFPGSCSVDKMRMEVAKLSAGQGAKRPNRPVR
jgi:ferric-dicitrate binding protein FerR (iron transport regulator)